MFLMARYVEIRQDALMPAADVVDASFFGDPQRRFRPPLLR